MIKISVIVPVYNTASYLKDCLDSVLNQSFNDFEIICVNDGSTDNSLEVLKSYESKDSRIHIINQENKGLGAARNIAVKEASGEYILFLDSDDYIEKDTLAETYDLAVSKSVDLLIFKLINFSNETYEESEFSYFEMDFLKTIVEDNVFNWQTVKDRIFDIAVTAPGKLFKRDLIKNVRFPEDLIFEDSLFFIKVIFKAKKVFFYDKHLYHRRIRSDSIMNSSFESFSDCITIYDLVYNHLRKIGVYDEFAEQLFNRKCKDIYTRFTNVPDEYKIDFYNKIKSNFSTNKRRLENEGTLKICTERSLEIFNNALNSNSYREFELLMIIFDLEVSNDKLKLEKSIIKRRYETKITNLTNKDNEYKNEIENLNNSISLKLTNILRYIVNYFRKIIKI